MKKTVKTTEISFEQKETILISRRCMTTVPGPVSEFHFPHFGADTEVMEEKKMSRKRLSVLIVVIVSVAIAAMVGARYVTHSQEPTSAEVSETPSQTFTVTSVSNSGAGTLRQAITDANANAGLDTIAFALPGSGIRIIDISSVLPTITSPVVIDGTTQSGYVGTPLVFIRANGTGEAMKITAGGSTLKGLTFGNFDGTTTDGAILLSTAGGNVIAACTFGVLGDSTIDRNSNEVIVIDGIANNRIGGSSAAERNHFGGDTFNKGVLIKNGGSANRVVGNWFGVAPNGTAIPNRISVVIQDSQNNAVGGTTGVTPGGACTGECNVISGNDDTIGGVRIIGPTSTGNSVISNFVGLLADGQTVHRNRIAGIRITSAASNHIGGTTAAERNVITGNGLAGVIVESAGTTNNVVSGNYIGLKTDGVGTTATAQTTATEGILLINSSGTRIGGSTAGERNVISGNRNGIFSSQSSNNIIQGNYIGTDATGMARSSTLNHGVFIDGGANNTIGGTAGTTRGGACTGACNVISGNGQDGVSDGVNFSSGTTGNTIDGDHIGVNALGTAALLNGITPDGLTFTGKAIRLINSSSNTIGRDMRAPARRPDHQDAGPALPVGPNSIVRDPVWHHTASINGQGEWTLRDCLAGTTFLGQNTLVTTTPTVITSVAKGYEPDAPFINRHFGTSAFSTFNFGAKIRFTGPSNPFGVALISFYRWYLDRGADEPPPPNGDCPSPAGDGILLATGGIQFAGTSSFNDALTHISGFRADGTDAFVEALRKGAFEIKDFGHDNELRDFRQISGPEDPALLFSGTEVNNSVSDVDIWTANPHALFTNSPIIFTNMSLRRITPGTLALNFTVSGADAGQTYNYAVVRADPVPRLDIGTEIIYTKLNQAIADRPIS